MRLAILTEGHTLKHKLMLKMLGWYVRADPPDVVRTMLYRFKFFGTPQGAFTHHAIQGSKHWSVGQCELFAAFVARQNQCPF